MATPELVKLTELCACANVQIRNSKMRVIE